MKPLSLPPVAPLWALALLLLLPLAAYGQKIALMPKGSKTVFWQLYIAGAQQAAQELSVELEQASPDIESNVAEQDRIFTRFVSSGFEAIVLTPLDKSRLVAAVEAAVDGGVVVVVTDSALESARPVCFIASDNRQAGTLGGEFLAAQIGADAEGVVLNIRFLQGSASTEAREEGAYEALVAALPKAETSKDLWGGVVLGGIKRQIDSQIDLHPNVIGVLATNTLSTLGAYKSLKGKGLAGKVPLVGSGVHEELLEGLANGEISGLYVQNPYEMGYVGVKTAHAALVGESVPRRIVTEVALLTKDNLSAPENRKLIAP